MIHELRCYTPKPAQKDKLIARFENGTFALFKKHGFVLLNFWTRPGSEECWYILEWQSTEQMQSGWESFKADQQWQDLKARSESGGALVESIVSIVLKPLARTFRESSQPPLS